MPTLLLAHHIINIGGANEKWLTDRVERLQRTDRRWMIPFRHSDLHLCFGYDAVEISLVEPTDFRGFCPLRVVERDLHLQFDE